MKIDQNRLRQQLDGIARNTLRVVSASSLKLLALDVNAAVKKTVQKAIDLEYEEMSNRLDDDELSKFLDLSNGYMVTMSTWLNKTPVNFPQIPIMEEPDEIDATDITLREIVKRKEVQTLGIGTALSVILFFSGIKIVALVTEAIAAATSIYLYKQGEERTKVVNQQAKAKFEREVNEYVAKVINAAMNWVDLAIKKSDSLIVTYS